MNYIDSIKVQKGLVELLVEFDSDWFVTLTFNRTGYSYAAAKVQLERFHARLDRLQLGKHWSQSTERTEFIAVPEIRNGTLHYHLFLKLATDPRNGFDWEGSAPGLWKKIVPAGTVNIQPIGDKRRRAEYVTKDAWRCASIEHFVLSSEFISDD